MELTQLIYFKEVAERQHFRRAAEALHITQPTLSQTVARLEEELGCRLFDRTGRSAVLNDFGKAYYRSVCQALNCLEDGRRRIEELKDGTRGEIYIGVTVPELISDCLEEYLQSHPGVHIHQQHGTADRLLGLLGQHKLDFALTVLPAEVPETVWEPVITERYGVLVSENHPLAGRESVSLSELRNEKFIVNNANEDLQLLFRRYFSRIGFTPEVVFEGEQHRLIGTLVANGRGISLCTPRRYSYNRAGEGDRGTVLIPVTDEDCSRTAGLAVLRDRPLSPAAETFYRFLKQALQQAENTD